MGKNNYRKIRDEVRKIVKKACYDKNNKFTDTVWQYHILPVIKHSLMLGRKLKADLEVLEISALLHDYASLLNKNYYKEHHLYGARLAQVILNKFGYGKQKTGKVMNCILSHRGSLKIKPKSLEARILASADAMSHFSSLADMMYLTYGVHKYKTEEGALWLKNKLVRSYKKIMPEGRKLILSDYKIAIKILDKAINNI